MTRRTLALLVGLALFAGAAAAEDSPARLATLLEDTDLSYGRVQPGIWALGFEGESLESYDVLLTTHEDLVVMFVVVATNEQFEATPEMVRDLLQCNTDLDRVKVGLDDDGDVFVRIDITARTLDSEDLAANVNQTAAAADEVYRRIERYMTNR